jgi:hypothetical protein
MGNLWRQQQLVMELIAKPGLEARPGFAFSSVPKQHKTVETGG